MSAKTSVIIATIFLVVLTVGMVIHFTQNISRVKKVLENERYTRLTAEENLEKAAAEIKDLKRELARSQDKIKNSEKVLEQTKSINTQLQSRMEEAASLQKSLNEKIEQLQQVAVTSESSVKNEGN